MLNKKSKFCLILTVFITSILMLSNTTSADLSVKIIVSDNKFLASTLQMLSLDTSNENQLSSLFQINGLIPGGFSVKAFRLKKEGDLGFNYQLKSIKINGDDNLYEALNIKIMQNDKFIFQGKLSELNQKQKIEDQNKEDWIFFVSLDSDNQQLANKSCEFELNLKTYRDNPEESGGFRDEIKVSNYISSGNW